MGPDGGDHRHLEFGLGACRSELHPPPQFLVAAQLVSGCIPSTGGPPSLATRHHPRPGSTERD